MKQKISKGRGFGLPFDQPTLELFSVKTSSHSKQTGLQDLVLGGQGQERYHLHLLRTILCSQHHLNGINIKSE